MRALRLHQPAPVAEEPLRLEEVPEPEPGPGELRIRVRACAVCRTDLHVVEGDLEPRRMPVIPGHQVVGTVDALGPGVAEPVPGTRVGLAWLHRTCGRCRFCRRGRENLCLEPDFTGWTVDGGFAEAVVAPAAFVHPLPDGFPDLQAAPLLCAGIIGWRTLERTGIQDWSGRRLGIWGFGAAGHVVLQLARARGAEVHVFTRDRDTHRRLAEELGAVWTGGPADRPPHPLDAALVFAPAGELVPHALAALDRGGVVALGGIHMSPTPPLPYELLYQEREIRSVANNTRADARAFLAEAARLPVRTEVEVFPLEAANEALLALRDGAIRGAAVLQVAS